MTTESDLPLFSVQHAHLVAFLRTTGDCTLKQAAKGAAINGFPEDAVYKLLVELEKLRLVVPEGKRHWRAAKVPASLATEREWIEHEIKHGFERDIEKFNAERKKLAAALLNEDEATAIGHADYQVRWASGFASVTYRAKIAFNMLRPQAGETVLGIVERARDLHEQLRSELLRNNFRQSSSSGYANAYEGTKAEETRDIYQRLDGLLDCLATYEARAPRIAEQEALIQQAAVKLGLAVSPEQEAKIKNDLEKILTPKAV